MQEEAEHLRTELLTSRKALRGAHRNLLHDINKLASEARFVNIALMPTLVTFIAISAAIIRYYRRRARTAGI
jgi:hypothetical protein